MKTIKTITLLHDEKEEKLDLSFIPIANRTIHCSKLLEEFPDGCFVSFSLNLDSMLLVFEKWQRCQVYLFDHKNKFTEYISMANKMIMLKEPGNLIILPKEININISTLDSYKMIMDQSDHILVYAAIFREHTTLELVHSFNSDVRNPGWVGARGAYHIALRDEFRRRGIDISTIANDKTISLNNKVVLLDKKLHIVTTN